MSKLSQTQYGTGKFNKPLYDLRMRYGWSQKEFGKAIGGYEGHTIMRIENGISGGKIDFWKAVQDFFDIPSENMWDLINGNETENK